MNSNVQSTLKISFAAAALALAMVAPAAQAAATWVNSVNTLGLGETITSLAANSNKQGWTGNPALTYDAWGMQGSWLSFNLTNSTDTVITATSAAATMAPAFTVYRTDGSWAGSTVGADATTLASNGAIHKFSQVAQAGQNGLIWATGVGGVVETLGYANSGNSYAANSFGQSVNYGVNDVSLDNLYETAISGTVGAGLASMKLNNLAAGWYTIFVSGANASLLGSAIDVSVQAVPVPAAVWLFGSALVGLVGSARRKQAA